MPLNLRLKCACKIKFKVLITEAGFEKIIGLLNNTFCLRKNWMIMKPLIKMKIVEKKWHSEVTESNSKVSKTN